MAANQITLMYSTYIFSTRSYSVKLFTVLERYSRPIKTRIRAIRSTFAKRTLFMS